ncbi:MAG: type II toxin-antitoxin system HicA family toxin [Bryobacteraceae bacterium]|nr:type II toxin-antitoxin system HicA family toxin [Bryobacteraceae bacterium]
MPITVRQLIRLLERNGWIQLRVKGSHRQFRHFSKPLVITVPGNEGRELASGTLNDILKKAGLK